MISRERVYQAISELKAAIAAFSEFYEIPYEAVYPPGAGAEEIRHLAALMGQIPPSYRMFLEVHRFFPEIDGNCDLLPPDRIRRLVDTDPASGLALSAQLPDRDLGSLFVIGRPKENTGSFILFDRSMVSADGEWAVVEIDGKIGFDGVHPDFVSFLESTAENIRAAIEGEEDWRDILDV